MADAIFDTTVFIDYWRGDPAARQLITDVVDRKTTAAVSPITAIELWQYYSLGRQEEIEYVALLSLCEEASLDNAIAKDVGQAIRAYSRSQRRRCLADAVIATTAKYRGIPVYSRNDRHLLRFYGAIVKY